MSKEKTISLEALTSFTGATGKLVKDNGNVLGQLAVQTGDGEISMTLAQWDAMYAGFVRCWPSIKPLKDKVIAGQRVAAAEEKEKERAKRIAEKAAAVEARKAERVAANAAKAAEKTKVAAEKAEAAAKAKAAKLAKDIAAKEAKAKAAKEAKDKADKAAKAKADAAKAKEKADKAAKDAKAKETTSTKA